MSIDNPAEKIRELIPQDQTDVLGALLEVGGAFLPFAAIASAVDGHLNNAERWQRISAALRALCDELQRLEERWPADLAAALASRWFKKALGALIEESAREVSEDGARRLAKAAAHGCFPGEENKHRQEDLATYIRDIARLGEDDIQMLKLLRDAYSQANKTAPNMNNPNLYANHYDGYKRMAEQLSIHEDDRIALGARLSGFGLAYEPPVQPFPGQHMVRPTRRGLYLLSLLEAAEIPKDEHN